MAGYAAGLLMRHTSNSIQSDVIAGGGAALSEDGADVAQCWHQQIHQVSCTAAHRVAVHDRAQCAQQRPSRYRGMTLMSSVTAVLGPANVPWLHRKSP